MLAAMDRAATAVYIDINRDNHLDLLLTLFLTEMKYGYDPDAMSADITNTLREYPSLISYIISLKSVSLCIILEGLHGFCMYPMYLCPLVMHLYANALPWHSLNISISQ